MTNSQGCYGRGQAPSRMLARGPDLDVGAGVDLLRPMLCGFSSSGRLGEENGLGGPLPFCASLEKWWQNGDPGFLLFVAGTSMEIE